MSHYCDFCGVTHSASSCFHPGRHWKKRAERAEAERDAYRDALVTLATEEWRDDGDPILDAARVKARAALRSGDQYGPPVE